ncbi:MAG: IS21-like element helper ATPase IstB [Actinomycetota bacterium]
MLTGPTFDKLITLNLGGMARALAEQRESPAYAELPFEDRLGLLVDREATERENRRLERYLRAAKLRVAASVEDVDFRAPRGLDRALVLELAQARWVAAHQQVLLTGPTGVGKTYLACALAAAAIRAGHTALYARVPRLLAEIGTARADGRLARLLSAWARIEVLVLDDFALQPLTDAQAADLLEVIEDRAGLRSTIVTSQLPVALWHEGLGEPTVADAICDRLLAGAHRIELTGASLRRPEPRTVRAAPASDGPGSRA